MSSNIRLQKICQHCGKRFTANTTVIQFCSDTCAKRAYKQRKRNEKIEVIIKEETEKALYYPAIAPKEGSLPVNQRQPLDNLQAHQQRRTQSR